LIKDAQFRVICHVIIHNVHLGLDSFTLILVRKLAGRTVLFITDASRGIGKAIALKAARDGANIVIAAKTAKPHPK
jgi:hypothetical protein